MAILHSSEQEAKIIAAKLRGQILHVPNLENLFAGWPLEIHPRLGDLVRFSEDLTRT